ncbi:MAG TPA: Fic family protein [Bacteriovoracaceae bacterium]|nr:Fic family protein [Bacteriovoracaceae bacterium]
MILALSIEIQDILGELKTSTLVKPSIKLRKENKIKTVHHSLAIEGNTLTEEQITALLEKKRVIGPKKHIQEVQNALKLYDDINTLNPFSEKDLLKSHSLLMQDLVESSGRYRSTNVGIIKGNKVGHVAPQAKVVSGHMKDLFAFMKSKDAIPLLIKACIFHYELEFIHPFEDGNGRMGRLWQQVLLMKHSEIFEFVSVESLIHKEQKKYYKVLEACDKAGNSTAFIEFSLELILIAVKEFKNVYRPSKITGVDRVRLALETFGKSGFTRKEYLNLHKDISTATASRDLASAVGGKILVRLGDKALATYMAI